MWDPLYDQVIAWVGLALLLILCLPFARIGKVVLEVYALVLRLALLAVVAAGAYLWFWPDDLPAQVTDVLSTFPFLGNILPEPGTQHFGVCAASLVVFTLLPLLAVLDVSRKLAGRKLGRLRALARQVKTLEESPAPPAAPTPVRRVDRRAAAATLAEAGSGRSLRGVNQPR
jgi:hypothetical protein